MKILSTLLLIITLSTSVNAASELDDRMKNQCQYIIYGNGSDDLQIYAYLMGLVNGMGFAIDSSDYALPSTTATEDIVQLVCKIALDKRSTGGFHFDFKLRAMRLMSKEHSKLDD